MARNINRQKEISQIVNSIRIIRNSIERYSKELYRNFEITGPQLGTLRLISLNPNMTLGELSDKIYLHISTVSGIVDRLESQKYLTRLRGSDDRRVVYLNLTDKGREIIQRAPASSFGSMVQSLEKMPLGELRRLCDAMEKLLKMMKIDESENLIEN